MQGGSVAAAIRDVYTSLLACSASNDYPVCARKAPKFRGQKSYVEPSRIRITDIE
jgi:hypothetical protein